MSGYSDFLVWGNNQDSLLSNSNSKSLTTPTPFSLPFDVNSICASEKHIAFLAKDGSVYSFGSNLDGRLGVSTRTANKASSLEPIKVPIPDRVIKIECGFSHVCALTENMQIYSWGLGDYGALGTGQFKSKSIPTKVELPQSIVTNIKQISCGAMHTSFLTQKGDVYMCGSNQYGQLGINRPEKISTPTPISFHLQVQQVSCGVFYTLLLTKQGKIYGMGNNKYGQLGIGHKVNESHPTLIRQLDGIVKITAGYHSGAIDQSGNIYIWGSGSFGEYLKPKKFVLSVPIRDISIRGFFGLAIGHNSKYESRIYTWGNNTFGQLGIGTFEAAQQPLQVQALRGVQAKSISLGVNFALLVLHNDRQPFNYSHRSPHIYQMNTLTERKQITRFDDSNSLSYRKNRSRSRQLYRNPAINFDSARQRQVSPNPVPLNTISYGTISNGKNYQKLFLTLSQDYEILFQKYQNLERQMQGINSGSLTNRVNVQNQVLNNQIQYQNKLLKTQVTKLRAQNQSLLAQNFMKKQQIIKLLADNQNFMKTLSSKKNNTDHIALKIPNRMEDNNLINQLQAQYNKILNEKQLLISQLNHTQKKKEDELYNIIDKLKSQRKDLESGLFKQKQRQHIQKQAYRAQIDAITEQFTKQKKKNALIDEQLQKYKNQLKIQQQNLKKYEILNNQLETSLMQSQRKHHSHNQQVLKKQILIEKVQQLEMQLNYEKQFNKKYQSTVQQLQEIRQKIYKQLTAEMDVNKAQKLKIQQLKLDIQNYKKYKKDADEKAIQIQQIHQNFNIYKQKTQDIVREKDQRIDALETEFERRNKSHAEQIKNKQQFIQELNSNIHRMQKQINKIKETVTSLKQQILMKDQQMEHLSQSKATLQKKNQYLQAQYQKQYEQRQRMGSQLNECRRQNSKIKITINQLQDQLSQQKQKNMRLNTTLNLKQDEIDRYSEQSKRQEEKIGNLTKQNTMYREEIQELSTKLEKQIQINKQLARANEEFAVNEQQFTQRISQLEKQVRELQDQNKSYTPRYEALLQRNRELDQRNRELGQMINKAVEIQAQSYKNTILKQVEINADQFLHDVNDEQTFKNRGKRNIMSKELSRGGQQEIQFHSPLGSQELKVEEPYTKMMKERISAHKRKVSESAHKLANLLNMNDGQQYRSSHRAQKTQDYQQINSQMQNFSNHKEEFISKIHSYAEKLKIL